MRLSEAIRLGAMWKPQAFEGPDKSVSLPRATATCALAAAAEAAGDLELNVFTVNWNTRWPVSRQLVLCPRDCHYLKGYPGEPRWPLTHMITHLNDHHRWTREQIADWVETCERESMTAAEAHAIEVGTT